MSKICIGCKAEKTTKEFPRNRATVDGLNKYCKLCSTAKASEYYTKNKAKVLAKIRERLSNPEERSRKNSINLASYYRGGTAKRKAKKYGIHILEIKTLLSGKCHICGSVPDPKHTSKTQRSLHIDHDHTTGRVRGALCSSCNFGLGKFKDSQELLRLVQEYLEKNRWPPQLS